MTKMHRLPLVVLVLATALGVAGAASAHEPAATGESKPHDMAGMNHDTAAMSEGSKQLHQAMAGGMKTQMRMTGNVDTDFATMMTMHHQQAIQMSDVLLKYGKQPELRALAQKMKASQVEEIQKMAPYRAPAAK